MKDLQLFDENGNKVLLNEVIEHLKNFTSFRNDKGIIFYVDLDKIDQNIIDQLRNFLNSREKQLKQKNKNDKKSTT